MSKKAPSAVTDKSEGRKRERIVKATYGSFSDLDLIKEASFDESAARTRLYHLPPRPTRTDERSYKREAHRDAILHRHYIVKIGGVEYLASCGIDSIWAECQEGVAINSRNLISYRPSIKAAIKDREQQLANIESIDIGTPPKIEIPERPALNIPEGSPAYSIRKLEAQAEARYKTDVERIQAPAREYEAKKQALNAEVERLKMEISELEEIIESEKIKTIIDEFASRYESRARYYMSHTHVRKELRGLQPKPFTKEMLFASLPYFRELWIEEPTTVD